MEARDGAALPDAVGRTSLELSHKIPPLLREKSCEGHSMAVACVRGEIDIKGFGKLPLYFLEGEFPK